MVGNVSVNSPEVGGLYSLMDLIADPKRYKTALDAYVQARADAEASLGALQEKQSEIKAAVAKAEGMLADAEYYTKQNEATAQKLSDGLSKLDLDRASFDAYQATLASREKEVKMLESDLVARENALKAATDAADVYARSLQQTAAALSAKDKVLDEKISALHEVIG